jgi:hypothetical protein
MFGGRISRRKRRENFKMTKRKSLYIALVGAVLLVAGSVSVWGQTAQQTGDQSQTNSSTATKTKKKKKADVGASSPQAAPDSGTASTKKKTTPKKAEAADKSATADSSATPKSRSKKSSTAAGPSATAAKTPAGAAPAATSAKSKTVTPAATPAAATAPSTTPAATPAPAAPASAPASKTATAQQVPPANSAGMVWVNTDSGIYHKPGTRWYGKTKQGKYMTEADAVKAGYKASGKN